MAFAPVAFKGAVALHTIARLADCSYDELRELNPAVLRGAAKGKDGVTTLRVPASKGQALIQKLQGGAALPAADLTLTHTVKHGETLRSIAAFYHVDARRLARVNGVGQRRPLRRGMELTVPASVHAVAPAVLVGDDPRASTAY